MNLNLVYLLAVMILLIVAVSRWKVHPFIALLLCALLLGPLLGMGGTETVSVLLDGFGSTLRWIAIVVIVGAFIGEVLKDTGGALRISEAVVGKTGPRKLPWAMGGTGYLVSIPVFVDVAYIILQPVTEALAARSKKPVLVIGLALTAGLIVSHTLIPPTPGPLAVVSMLEADIGRLLLINVWTGLFALAGGVLWASHFCQRFWLPHDDKLIEVDADEESGTPPSSTSVIWDLTPILVPIFLMGAGSFLDGRFEGLAGEIIGLVGTPMIAVMIGAGIAAVQFKWLHEKSGLSELVENAISKSALVIMITGAGGAFGHIIRESGTPELLTAFFGQLPFLGFMLPFLIAAVLTTATGSITVSLIGTASIIGPMSGSLGYSPELIAALIGAGSLCVHHANSSFFWLLNRLHEVPVNVLYRTYTLQTLVMSLSAFMGILLLRVMGVD